MNSTPPTIYFDEAGNTGAHLLDPEQPVFTLAAVDLSLDECRSLLDLVSTPQAKEAKFTSLRKSSAGRDRLLKFITSPMLTPARAKLAITNKPFMVATKVVDLLIEPLAYDAGINLYENGTNLALAHVLFYTGAPMCGVDAYNEFISSFVAMVRDQTSESKRRFFASAHALDDAAKHPRFKEVSEYILMAEPTIDDILDSIDSSALDPAIPAFFYLCSDWGKQLRQPFDVIHDSSKPIAGSKALLESMMTEAVEPSLIGNDRRKFEFPLRATGIRFEDSKQQLGLQVADLLAGTVAYFAARTKSSSQDDFCRDLEAAEIERFTVMNIWPEPKITPEQLGTVASAGDSDATDTMAKFMFENPPKP